MVLVNTFKPQPPCKHRFHSGMVFIIYQVARVAEVRVADLFNKPTKRMTSSKLNTVPKRIHCEQCKPHNFFSKLVLENSVYEWESLPVK